MKKYETVTRTSSIKVLREVMCDFCGLSHNDEWKEGPYEVIETEIMMKKGESYPGVSFGEIISFDICPDCFVTKLIPWAKTQGAEPEIKEYDY